MKLRLNVLLLLLLSFLLVGCFGVADSSADTDEESSSSRRRTSSAAKDDSATADKSSVEESSEAQSSADESSATDSAADESSATDSAADESSATESATDGSTTDESSVAESSATSTGDDYMAMCGDKCGSAEVIDDHTLYFYEEFERNIPLGDYMSTDETWEDDGSDWLWTWGDGTFSGNLTRFVKDNIEFKNGSLFITQKSEFVPKSYSDAQNGEEVPDRNISGAELRTIHEDFHYGIYKVKMRISQTQGNVFATFFAYNIPRGEKWREIDIEVVTNHPSGGGEMITNLISTEDIVAENTLEYDPVFTMEYPANGGHDFSGLDNWNPNSGDWHEYSFEWKPGKLIWRIDDKIIREYSEDEQNKGGKIVKVPSTPLAIFMNFWTPEFFPGPQESEWPLTVEYDYIKYYKWNQSDFNGEVVLKAMQ